MNAFSARLGLTQASSLFPCPRVHSRNLALPLLIQHRHSIHQPAKPSPFLPQTVNSKQNDEQLLKPASDLSNTDQSQADHVKPPPYLPRPLGVEKPPSTKPLTKEEKLAKLVDTEARLQERKHLISEVSKGYYHDWNTLRHNGNKLWTAPPSLIQEQRALYFPDISGISLLNKQTTHTTDLFGDKISLIAIESTRMSEEHTRSFYDEITRMMAGEPNFQLIRLNVQENPLKSWLVSLFLSNLKKSVPEHQHGRYLLSNQTLEYVREPLGMVNKLLGYVYLIDQNKKVRWAGCGFANGKEMSGLFGSTKALVKRLDKKYKD